MLDGYTCVCVFVSAAVWVDDDDDDDDERVKMNGRAKMDDQMTGQSTSLCVLGMYSDGVFTENMYVHTYRTS